MSDLQLALIAGGAVFVLGVIAFNMWQERKARGKAEKAFGPARGDALFDAPNARDRVEPTLGGIIDRDTSDDITVPNPDSQPLPLPPSQELEAPAGPTAEI